MYLDLSRLCVPVDSMPRFKSPSSRIYTKSGSIRAPLAEDCVDRFCRAAVLRFQKFRSAEWNWRARLRVVVGDLIAMDF